MGEPPHQVKERRYLVAFCVATVCEYVGLCVRIYDLPRVSNFSAVVDEVSNGQTVR